MSYEELLAIRRRLRQRKSAHLEKLHRESFRIVAEAAKMGAKKVILFGSLSQGSAGIFSDLDMLIIMDSNLNFLNRTAEAYKRLKPEVGVDILVYTPDELKMMLESKNEFIRRVFTQGKVLYEI